MIKSMLLGLALLLGTSLAISQTPDGLRLVPENPTNGEGFGYAISLDNEHLAVSTRFTQSVYFFTFDGTAWQETGKVSGIQNGMDRRLAKGLGEVMTLNDNILLVAAPQGGTSSASKAGLVEVFTYDGSSWTLDAVVHAPEATAGAQFGAAIDVDQDWFIAGAPKLEYETGAAYLYHNVAGEWQAQTLDNPDERPTSRFGEAVAINDRFAIVGSPGFEERRQKTGALYFYEMKPEGWQLVQAFKGDRTYQDLGQSMAIQGDRLAVGAYDQVVIFERHIDQWEIVATLDNPNAGEAMSFASTLQLSPDGNNLIVGASEQAYLYTYNDGVWQFVTQVTNDATAFGSRCAINNQLFILNSPYEGEEFINGAIYNYEIATYLQALIR